MSLAQEQTAVQWRGGARDGEQGSRSRPRPPCAEGRCSRLTGLLQPPHQLQVLSHSRLPVLPLRRGRKNSPDAQLPLFLLPPSGRLTLSESLPDPGGGVTLTQSPCLGGPAWALRGGRWPAGQGQV